MGDHAWLGQRTADIRSKREGVWSGHSGAAIAGAKIRHLDPPCLVQDQSCTRLDALAEDEAAVHGVGHAAVQKRQMR